MNMNIHNMTGISRSKIRNLIADTKEALKIKAEVLS